MVGIILCMWIEYADNVCSFFFWAALIFPFAMWNWYNMHNALTMIFSLFFIFAHYLWYCLIFIRSFDLAFHWRKRIWFGKIMGIRWVFEYVWRSNSMDHVQRPILCSALSNSEKDIEDTSKDNERINQILLTFPFQSIGFQKWADRHLDTAVQISVYH